MHGVSGGQDTVHRKEIAQILPLWVPCVTMSPYYYTAKRTALSQRKTEDKEKKKGRRGRAF